MHCIRLQWVIYLPTNCIAGNRGEPGIPKPSQHICSCLDTCMLRARIVRVLPLLVICHGGIPFLRHSNANKKYIALLKSNATLLGNFLDI